VLTLIDVSGLKAAEDALFLRAVSFECLLASVPDAIYFKDAHGKFIRLNAPMATRLGLQDPREARARPRSSCEQRPTLALHAQDVAALRRGSPNITPCNARERRREREMGLATPTAAGRPSGQPVGIIGILRDVSELKNAERKVSEAVRRRDEFLAMLSHELRNPLGALVTGDRPAQERRRKAQSSVRRGSFRSSTGSRSRCRACSTTCST